MHLSQELKNQRESEKLSELKDCWAHEKDEKLSEN